MSSSAWVYQDDKQVKKHGAAKASWYVGWYNLDGKKRCKSCGPGIRGKSKAEKLRRKTEVDLEGGQYRENLRKPWEQFRDEYTARIGGGLSPRSRDEVTAALKHFERLIKPGRMYAIGTSHIDRFVAARRAEKGKKKGAAVSPATINKDLRHLRAALAVAEEWGYIVAMPKFRMEKTPKKMPTYISGEHFARVYRTCDVAKFPAALPYSAAEWWRGLLVTAYMTGWRISELLALRRTDLDLDAGIAITRAEDNKSKRDEPIKLHPVVIAHLRKLVCFDRSVFPWNYNRTTLYNQFVAIQEKAGIRLHCDGKHTHTHHCHVYGFHDLRRAFATMNADTLTPDALQALMRHKSYSTTQRYINTTRQMDAAVASLHVPEILKVMEG